MTDLSKETQRDAEILRLLSEAGKSLDDWQKNNAIATAFAKCSKAEQLSAGQPVNPRVVQLARGARQLLQAAQDSPSTTDMQKTREQLRKPAAAMVEILSGEVSDLAHLLRSVSDVNESIGEIISTASAAVAGKGE